jgi:hypothetical protein
LAIITLISVVLGLAVNRHPLHVNSPLSQSLHRMEHRMVFDGGGHDVVSGSHGAKNGEVIALGTAASEDNLRCAATEEPGNAGPGPLDRRSGALSFLVD